MWVSRVELKNFCQYDDVTFSFDKGLVGIVGRNGCGKTNLLKGIYYAMTGNLMGKGNKESYIKWGSTGKSYIKLCAVHGQDSIEIERHLNTPTNVMSINGVNVASGSTSVTEALCDYLNIDPQQLDIFFVHQRELDNFVDVTVANRVKMFLPIFGIKKANWIWEKMGSVIHTIEIPVLAEDEESIISQINEKKSTLSAIEREVANVGMTSEQISERLSELDSFITECFNLARRIEAVWSNVRIIKANLKECRENEERKEALMCAYNEEKERLNEMESKKSYYDEQKKLWEVYNRNLRLFEQYKSQFDELLSRRRQLVRPSYGGMEAVKDKLTAYNEEIDELNGKIKELELKLSSYKSLLSNSVCPVCKRPYDDKSELDIKKIKADIKECETLLEQNRKNLEKVSQYQTKCRKNLMEYESYYKQRYEILRDLNKLRDLKRIIECTEKPTASIEEIANYHNKLSASKTQCHTFLASISEIERMTGKIETYRKELETSRDALNVYIKEAKAKCGISDSPTDEDPGALYYVEQLENRIKSARNEQNELENKRDLMNNYMFRKQAETENLNNLEVKLEKVRELKKKIKKIKDGKQKLTSIRNAFSREAAPKLYLSWCVKNINAFLNDLLKKLEVPFSIHVNEELEFWATFNDGKRLPIYKLSVGERLVFALAWRIAIHVLFSGSIEFIALDEPFAGIDEQRMSHVPMVLSAINDYSISKNLQMFLVTHWEVPYVGQTINIGA